MRAKAASPLPLLLLLTGCPGSIVNSNPAQMSGYVEVKEPDGTIQKVYLTCRTIYNTNSNTFDLTGVSLPITSVIKPQIGGISTGINPQVVSDQLHGLDLQQLAICESLILLPIQTDIEQTFKDYVGAQGYLTQQIRTLNSSTNAAQYQQAANNLANNPSATVASTTATAMTQAQNQPHAGATVNAPSPAVFPTQPSLNAPPNPANVTPPAPRA